jgi:hypothetical protein
MHVLWFEWYRILQVLVNIMYINIIQCWYDGKYVFKWLITVAVYVVIILCVQTSIPP